MQFKALGQIMFFPLFFHCSDAPSHSLLSQVSSHSPADHRSIAGILPWESLLWAFLCQATGLGERFQCPNSQTSLGEILPGLQLLLIVGWWWQQEPRDGELFGDSNISQVLRQSRDFLKRQRFHPRCCCSPPSTGLIKGQFGLETLTLSRTNQITRADIAPVTYTRTEV